MKKALSLVLVLSMLVSLVAIIPFTAGAEHTLDENNVGTEAYKFNGSVEYAELYGIGPTGKNKYTWLDAIPVKTGTGSGKLLIDGKIEEGEWGTPSFSVHSDYAANNGGRTSGQNINFEVPAAENTYFYYDASKYTAGSTTSPMAVGMGYTVYLMWDEDYIYIAADVYDPDGHKNMQTGKDAWNGDAFQFRIDKDGPNSVVGGKGYNAYKIDPETSAVVGQSP